MEHGQNDYKSIENLVRASENCNLAPIIRVSENSPYLIGKALDTGAIGIQVPNVSSKLEAERAVEAAKFYPKGNRGVCRFVRNADYGTTEKSIYFNFIEYKFNKQIPYWLCFSISHFLLIRRISYDNVKPRKITR